MKKSDTQEMLKRMQPGKCMKFITVNFDYKLMDSKFAGDLLTSITECGSNHTLLNQIVPSTVTWTTKTLNNGKDEDKNESPLLLILYKEEFFNLIEEKSLINRVETIQNMLPDNKLTLAIFGLESYFNVTSKGTKRKLSKNNKNESDSGEKKKIYTREEVEDILSDLQILYDCPVHNVDTSKDVGRLILQFTKSIAEAPLKLENSKLVESLGWVASSDLKDCIRVDKNGNGLSQLWLHQLMQFNNSGLDIAQAIIQQYPTPLALYDAYRLCNDPKEGQDLLKDIMIRRGFGEAVANRRVGPELSKKIYYFFTSDCGDSPLSQE